MAEHEQLLLTLELREDERLIQEYEEYHRPGNTRPAVIDSIRESGIIDMKIYRSGTRLVMILIVDESFSLEKKAKLDKENPEVAEWERLMSRFQVAEDDTGAKWKPMSEIFDLCQHTQGEGPKR